MNRRKIRITPEGLVRMFTEGSQSHFEIVEGLPEGTEVVGIDLKFNPRELIIIVEHESFDDSVDELSPTLRSMAECWVNRLGEVE